MAPRAGLEIDWSDPDTLIGVAGGVLGLLVGIGAPLFYISRDELDEQRLEELRELNRQTFKETGEYLSEVISCFQGCYCGCVRKYPCLPDKFLKLLAIPFCRRRSRHSDSHAGLTAGEVLLKSLSFTFM